MRGRKTMGPRLVRLLEGSEHAKQRLEVILRTLGGELTIEEASHKLGIQQARFNVIRRRALKAALNDLEPRRPGRPTHTIDPRDEQLHELQARITELEQELALAQVRSELAAALPQLAVMPHEVKKTNHQTPTRRDRATKRRSRRLGKRK